MEYEVILVDASESPVKRPKKDKDTTTPGRRNDIREKSQLAVNKQTKKIICTHFAKGRTHDFRLFKNSKLYFKEDTKAITDSGYQGITDIHPNSRTPYKRKRKQKDKPRVPLSKTERAHNHQLASDRILNEHVIGALKRFRILAEKYRNRRKRFGLRWNLIAGIYNLQVGF
jgi:hypothetical protein